LDVFQPFETAQKRPKGVLTSFEREGNRPRLPDCHLDATAHRSAKGKGACGKGREGKMGLQRASE